MKEKGARTINTWRASYTMRLIVAPLLLTLLLCVMWPQRARAQTIFQDDFGNSAVSGGTAGDPHLPTTLSTADAPYNTDVGCLNGLLRNAFGTAIPNDSASDGAGSNAFLFHHTGSCSYSSGQAVWRNINPIPVDPNTTYVFSYWIALGHASNPPILTQQVIPDAGTITPGNTHTPIAVIGSWVRRQMTFTTDSSTTAVTLRINNARATGSGNDFGLDDIRLFGFPPPFDFGDALDTYGTIFASDGARHDNSSGSNLHLGATVDTEDDGQPTSNADGDDAETDGTDDEDAFTVMPPMATSQTNYSVTVLVSNTSGSNATLVGWVDWNQNSVFDAGEGVASVVANNATKTLLTWTGLSGLTGGTTYARLRIAAEGEINTNTPTGIANSGEVEDYIFQLAVPPDDIFNLCPITSEAPPTNFTIKERWRTSGTQTLAYQTPLVGDLDGDGAPEVVIGANVNYAQGIGSGNTALGRLAQNLRIFRGSDGVLLNTVTTPYFSWSGNTAHALADVDKDGQSEIIFKVAGTTGVTDTAVRGRLIAYRNNGTVLWTSNQRYDYGESRGGFGLNLADFNGDGNAEVYIGNQIFNAQTGARLAALTAVDSSGCPGKISSNCFWGNSAAVDMDGDGRLELVAGNIVYKVNLVSLVDDTGNSLTVWQQAAAVTNVGDGWTAIADIDLDGDPDVVVVRNFNNDVSGNVVMYVWDGQTSAIMGITPQLNPGGSHPFIGDIDGDGAPEIVFVTSTRLRAYDYVVGTGLVSKWTLTTGDGSGVTTLTMFDFNSDGVTELVYRDEDLIRIINGSVTPPVNLASFSCSSGTGTEMPVVADIDGSGMAQILVTCADSDNNQGDVRAFTTNSFPWANARPVWNQQAYFVSHINNDLTVPAEQFPHWTTFSDAGQVCSDGINRPLNAFLLQVGDLDITTGCPVVCQSADFGDAPASYGTLLTIDGARHGVLSYDNGTNTAPLMLGSFVDTDSDGQPNGSADGDDNGAPVDDEDGVTFPSAFAPGQTLQIPVQVTGTGGRLHAWIDWNRDGDFGDAGEQIATDVGVVAGSNFLSVTVPADAALDNTYARFRLTTQSTLGPTGPSSGGEVEDYPVTVGIPVLVSSKRDIVLVDADSSGTASPGDTLRYTVIITNSGVGMALNARYTDTLDSNTALVVGSVTTSQGSVTTGNNGGDSNVVVAISDIAPNSSVSIVYDAVINNPLPAGVILVSNQGIVGIDNPGIPDVPTDDPDDPDPDDPTTTPISAAPKLEAFKRDALLVDADSSAAPSPGDTLLYTVTIINNGNQAASNMVYTDSPDPNTTLVVGSVTTSQGSISTGNSGGDSTVAVNIGNVTGGGAVVIVTYQVTINSPVPVGVTEVKNQGIVSVDNPNIPETLTDDPDDPSPDDPTETPINAQPIVEAFKKSVLLVDADSSNGVSPGDTLQYQVTIINSGNQNAPDVIYTDTPDANTNLVIGSVTTTQGTVTNGNTNGDSQIGINIGTLAGQGGQVLVTYNAIINNSVPAGVTQVTNQGIVTDSDPRTPDEPTDDPDDPDEDDPTNTPIDASPQIQAYKRDTLLVDADNNGSPSPGDTLLYNITIINSGNQAATDLVYVDNLDPNTTLIVGTVASNAGTITTGNSAGDESVEVAIGSLAGGNAEANISYQVTINTPLPAGVTQVSNQGNVTSDDPKVPDMPTDDPDDPDPDDPTDTPINASPKIQAYKRDTLFIDADSNGSPSPGDTLLYNITIINSGTQASGILTFTDHLDPHVTIVAGSLNTDRGTVIDGNDAGDTTILINLSPLPGGGASANISYRVTINNPLAAGVTQVSNQGIVTSDDPKVPDTTTDDPDDPDEDDPTDTPINASPKLQAYKRDTLLVDADNNGSPSPGDTLLYNITIINSGNQAVIGLVYDDNPDPNTTLVVGSVVSDVGTVVQGNSNGDTGISVEIGTLPGGDSVVNISYHATINNPLPAEVVQVSNQGIVSSDSPHLPDTPTDDPDDPEKDDPTDTVVVAAPLVDVYKQASLLTDADNTGSPSPGDTLLYKITIVNNGNQAAINVFYEDTPDPNTTLIVGSVASAVGTIIQGNNSGNSRVQVSIGTIPGGSNVEISYRVTINTPLPPNVVQVSNQGTTTGDIFPDEPSDDPSTPGLPKDPTDVVVVAAPVLAAHKLDTLLIDLDGNGAASPGDSLLYNVTVINHGNTAATGVIYTDTPDANTQLAPGSVRTNLGNVTTGNNAGDTSVAINVGEIPAGSQLLISYQVQINPNLPETVKELRNQGIVHNDNDIMPCPEEGRTSSVHAVHCPAIPTNDPSTPAASDPTVTPIDPDPTAEEPSEQPREPRTIFLPQINHKFDYDASQ